MPETIDNPDKLPQLETLAAPSIQDALRALELWQNLDRLYAPVRALENPQSQIGFSINSSPMLNTTAVWEK